jgi:signal transduction histidine kinase
MRKRILFGLLPLLILLLVIGAYAVSLFAKLGGAVEVILRENYTSVVAMHNIKGAAQNMDSALLLTFVDERDLARKRFAESAPVFQHNLDVENATITLPGEGDLAKTLTSAHQRYLARAADYLAASDPAVRRQMYFSELLPMVTEIQSTADKILKLNQDNMVKANADARALSTQSTRYMFLAILAGGVVAIFFAVRLQRSILGPITALTSSAKELGDGNLDQVVAVASRDELGQLADTFNKMASKLRAYRHVVSEEILQAKQMTAVTFSAFPDPIIALNADGQINFKNPAAENLLLKLSLEDQLPEQIHEQVKDVLAGREDYVPTSFASAICVRPGGKETFFLPRVIGIRDDKGTVFGAAVVLQNVTRLRLMDEVKTNLVATVSHELKTPLTSVRMALYLLLEEAIGALNPKQTELLVAARDDSERLLTMINTLLDLARIESGETRMLLAPLSPCELVRNAVADSKDFAASLGARLSVDCDESLPEVGVEESRIAHVFSNFITNAAKHSPRGEEIILKASAHEDGVRFAVIDKGEGIPQQFQSRLFDKFYRVPGSNRAGAGLGLSIAREIVQAHHGGIGVNSAPGQGSEFYFILPKYQKGETK